MDNILILPQCDIPSQTSRYLNLKLHIHLPIFSEEPLRRKSTIVRIPNPQQQSMHATENKLTRISLAIVWMFIFCHVWKLIPTLYEAMQNSDKTEDEENEEKTDWPQWYYVINNVAHLLIVFNSAVNFLIYSIL